MKKTFLRVLKFLQIKEGGPNFWGNQFCRMSELFGPPFCISILKVLWTQILRHSLDLSPFCMNEEDFSQSAEISTNSRGGDIISGGSQSCRMSEVFGPHSRISILKVFKIKIRHHSLHFNVFSLIQEYLFKSPEISTN